MCVALNFTPQRDVKLKEHSVDKKMFKYQPKIKCEIDKKYKKLIKLTILNFELIKDNFEKYLFFFDIQKRVIFNFFQTLKTLHFPAFTVRSKAYKEFFEPLIQRIAENYFIKHMHFGLPLSDEDTINILRFVVKTNNSSENRALHIKIKEVISYCTNI